MHLKIKGNKCSYLCKKNDFYKTLWLSLAQLQIALATWQIILAYHVPLVWYVSLPLPWSSLADQPKQLCDFFFVGQLMVINDIMRRSPLPLPPPPPHPHPPPTPPKKPVISQLSAWESCHAWAAHVSPLCSMSGPPVLIADQLMESADWTSQRSVSAWEMSPPT